uniref:Uncharacterized protein n=1 Tax=Caudovirales sp. ctkvU4 TaxID=2826783 RepID=A0A8S5QQG1_9CAUD|nr:MAG TPA: hypothetical protein [Caudovirales sp. ctkvU4]
MHNSYISSFYTLTKKHPHNVSAFIVNYCFLSSTTSDMTEIHSCN